jgi:hypothetical protein
VDDAQPISDDELLVIYDEAFDGAANKRATRPGKAHIAALRAIYERGVADATKARQ